MNKTLVATLLVGLGALSQTAQAEAIFTPKACAALADIEQAYSSLTDEQTMEVMFLSEEQKQQVLQLSADTLIQTQIASSFPDAPRNLAYTAASMGVVFGTHPDVFTQIEGMTDILLGYVTLANTVRAFECQ